MRAFLFLSAALAAANAAEVVELTQESFDATIDAEPGVLWLVKFYAPWCGHCKKMAPVLQAYADELEGTDLGAKVRVGKVDCTEHTGVRDKLEIRGYPTTMLFRDGNRWEMDGPRTKEGLRATVDQLMRLPVAVLAPGKAGQAALDELLAPEASVVFALVRGAEDSGGSLVSAFYATAVQKQLLSTFVVTSSTAELSQLAGAAPAGSVLPLVLKLVAGESPIAYVPAGLDSLSPAALSTWVERERFPTFSIIDRHNFHSMLSPDGTLALAVIDPDASCPTVKKPKDMDLPCGKGVALDGLAATQHLGALLRSVATANAASGGVELGSAHHVRFGLLDGRKWGAYLSEMHGVERAQLPVLLLVRGGSPRSFHVERYGPFAASRANDAATLRQLLRDAGSGALRLELTGTWGISDRLWNRLKGLLPMLPLGALDFLPRYTFAALLALLVLAGLIMFIISTPAAPYDEAPRAKYVEPPQPEKKGSKKAD